MFVGFGLAGCNFAPTDTTAATTAATTVNTTDFIAINSVDDLQNIAANKSYILETDLDLADVEWTPIGDFNQPYLGVFDGNGHTISNLTITDKDTYYAGLFGYVQGEIKNLNLFDVNIDFTSDFLTYVGGAVGYLEGDIANVNVTGSINVKNSFSTVYAGLLAGLTQANLPDNVTEENFQPNVIDDCVTNVDITVDSLNYAYVGGLIGMGYNSTVTNNKADTQLDVTGKNYPVYVGGLFGHFFGGLVAQYYQNDTSHNMDVSYNLAKATITVPASPAGASIGGLFGYVDFANLTDNAVSVTMDDIASSDLSAGGLVGELWNSSVENSVVFLDVTVASGTATDQNIGSIFGQDYSDTSLEKVYFNAVADQSLGLVKSGTETDACNFKDAGWLSTNLNWDMAFSQAVIILMPACIS